VTPEEFKPRSLEDPRIRGLLDKVEVVAAADLEPLFPERQPCRVTIETTGGECHELSVDYPKGHPENPMDLEELRDKFVSLASSRLREDQVDRVLEVVQKLDESPDLGELFRALCPEG
jgi:2-methylcitrate dehydratase